MAAQLQPHAMEQGLVFTSAGQVLSFDSNTHGECGRSMFEGADVMAMLCTGWRWRQREWRR